MFCSLVCAYTLIAAKAYYDEQQGYKTKCQQKRTNFSDSDIFPVFLLSSYAANINASLTMNSICLIYNSTD